MLRGDYHVATKTGDCPATDPADVLGLGGGGIDSVVPVVGGTGSSTALIEPHTPPNFWRDAFRSIWKALTLQEDAYTTILEAEKPSRQGFKILLVALLIASMGTSLGAALDYLTMPRYDLIQERAYTFITQSDLYRILGEESPLLGELFPLIYKLTWLFLQLQGVEPTGSMILLSFFNVLMSGVFAWFTYAFLSNLLGPRLGGSAEKGALWGAMALAFTPQVLMVANLIPGLTVPPTLVSFWTLACVYQAVRVTYSFSRSRSVGLVVLVYLLNILLILLALVLGVLLGVFAYRMMG
jgi:hypothetical protein